MHLCFLVTLDLWGLWKTPSFWELCNKETIFEGKVSQHFPPKFVLCVMQNIEVHVWQWSSHSSVNRRTKGLWCSSWKAQKLTVSFLSWASGEALGHFYGMSAVTSPLSSDLRFGSEHGYNELGSNVAGTPSVTWPAHGGRGGCECNMAIKWRCLCLHLLLFQLLTPAPVTPSPNRGSPSVVFRRWALFF